jgi:peroxiredoxin
LKIVKGAFMPNTNKPILEKEQIIPAFTLPGADGMPHSPWDYKQRENLVLLFLNSTTSSEERGILQAFAQSYAEFREEKCAILVITADPVIMNLEAEKSLHLPFALLANPKGDVISRYTTWDSTTRTLTPSIVLTNRYGALEERWVEEHEADLPTISELMKSLNYLNSMCTP